MSLPSGSKRSAIAIAFAFCSGAGLLLAQEQPATTISHQVREDGCHPTPGAPPIELLPFLMPMGNRNAGPSVQHPFANRRNGPGVVDVRAEIGAMVDAAQNPSGIRRQLQQPKPGAVCRRAMNGETVWAAGLDSGY